MSTRDSVRIRISDVNSNKIRLCQLRHFQLPAKQQKHKNTQSQINQNYINLTNSSNKRKLNKNVAHTINNRRIIL